LARASSVHWNLLSNPTNYVLFTEYVRNQLFGLVEGYKA
jgi:hypothetical protein